MFNCVQKLLSACVHIILEAIFNRDDEVFFFCCFQLGILISILKGNTTLQIDLILFPTGRNRYGLLLGFGSGRIFGFLELKK